MLDPALNIFADLVILKPLVCPASNGSVNRSFMGLVCQVIACVNRRGITLKFARDCGRTSLESFRDLPDRFAFAFKDG